MNQYFCARHTGVRVYPFSSLERDLRTLAPSVHANAVLLASFNSRAEVKVAWCFVCHRFSTVETVSRDELRQLYLQRPVAFRPVVRRRRIA